LIGPDLLLYVLKNEVSWITQLELFVGEIHEVLSNKWRRKAKKYKTTWHKLAWDLMCQLLAIEPANRLTAQQALRHPFFTNSVNKCQGN